MESEKKNSMPDHVKIGLFGAGHLGRAIAEGLIGAGIRRENLSICHRDSAETIGELEALGLADLVKDSTALTYGSDVIFYLVRPQNYDAIKGYALQDDVIIVSFMAGVPLDRLPVNLPANRRVRVMTSAPDTIRRRNGIAALYPANNQLMRGILSSLGLRVVPLHDESGMHVFTSLGPCMPIALTFWESLGRATNDAELLEMAASHGMPDYAPILNWAKDARRTELTDTEKQRYFAQAATPGGVTEAILNAMKEGRSLSESLEKGMTRSRELAVR